MNFVLVIPQHINVSNPVTKMFKQEENQHDHFLYRKVVHSFVSKMQNKEDTSSYLHRICIAARTKCIYAVIPSTNDLNTTTGTTSPGRQ